MHKDTSGLMHRDYADWFVWAGPRGLLLMRFIKGHPYELIYLQAVGLGLHAQLSSVALDEGVRRRS